MEKIRSYKDLKVYQKAMDLVIEIYKVTRNFPDTERFGLVSQMRRSAVSIPSNIAEGQQRNSLKEYLNFLSVARCSLAELETQINIVKRLDKKNRFNFSKIDFLFEEVSKMLIVMMNKLKNI